MKAKGKIGKIFSAFTAAAMCITMLPQLPAATTKAAKVGDKLTVQGGQTQFKGDCDGYSYEVWLDNTGGSGSMTLGPGATFKAEWSASVNRGNFLARRGLAFDSSKKATAYDYIGMDYTADYRQTGSASGNSRLCVYGWFQNRNAGNVPLVEYYIIEDWVDWCPDGNGTMVTIDGAQYKIFQNDHTGPSINSGSETFKQYFSVRQNKRKSGHITVSDHFKAWEKQGWGIGNLYEVALNAEGWQSSGVADVTELDVYLDPNKAGQGGGGGGTTTPSVPTETDGKFIKSTFESGTDNWSGRGGASVTTDSKNYYAGSKSLAVTGRTENWNGASIKLSTSTFLPGEEYSFSAGVLQRSGSATDMKMTLQYSDSSGTEQYDEIALVSAKSGEWTNLANTSYKIPSGASNLVLYIEAPDSLTDFYVDNFTADKKGTASSVTTGQGTAESGTTGGSTGGSTGGGTTTPASSDSLRGHFGSCFRMGTSVSPHELNSGADFIKKHFNSITPENELKPEQILKQGSSDNTRCNVDISSANATLSFCEKNGIGVRGHTFVWYSQTPEWFFKEGFSTNGAWVSKDTMNKRLENFIKDTFAQIAQKYPKLDLYAYDVCNELFVNDGGGLRPAGSPYSGGSYWAQVYGANNDEFILNAFKYARMYAPKNCKLYINDYNEYMPDKCNDIYKIAMKIKAEGNIDGIGMQSHLATNYPNKQQYNEALEKFISTGLDVQITELDIQTKDGGDNARASLFKDIFQLAVDHRDSISSFTVWGTHDDISWRKNDKPLMFGSNYTPKQDYNMVMSIEVPAETVTTTTTTATTTTTTTTTATPGVTASLYGDANCDGKVSVADVVIVMQSLANPSNYSLSAKGAANADVDQNGNGITSADALIIQQYLLRLITKLPDSYSTSQTTTTSKTTTTTKQASTTTTAKVTARYEEQFSSGKGDWASRGSASVALENQTYYSAGNSLKVSDRGDNWNGAQLSLPSNFKAGETYSFSAAVLQATGSAQSVKMTLQYTDASGTEQYDEIALVNAADKTWTKVENTAYKIPSGATNMVVYVELPDSLGDYYLDDVLIAAEGTKSSVVTGQGTVGKIETPVIGGGEVDPSKPMIAISFDDGTSSPYGKRIVNALAKEGFRATFFYVGNWIKDESEVKLAYEKGMEIANHTTSHPYLTQKSASEIRQEVDNCYNKLKNIIGANPSKLLRLPYLASNQTVQSTLNDYGLITCAIDTQDWNGASKDQIVNTIKQAMSNGSGKNAIVLCHETYESTASAIEELAPYIKAQGWQVVTISEMFAANGKKINGGQIYTKVQ